MDSIKTPHIVCEQCGQQTYLEDLLDFYRLFDDQAQLSDMSNDEYFCTNCILPDDDDDGATQ